MPAISRVTVKDWVEFKGGFLPSLYDRGIFTRGRFLFRGVSDSRWRLISSLDRLLSSLPTTSRAAVADELLDAFIEEHQHLGVGIDASDREMILALAQHSGLPTRLLDWSDSPYVAAYFAFSGLSSTSHDVAIWLLDRNAALWDADMGVQILRVRPVSTQSVSIRNVRLLQQAGSFTLMKAPFESLDALVEHANPPRPALVQVSIPWEERRTVLADLDAMGISATRMFPDAPGAALAARTRVSIARNL